ncbi:MAG: ribonuclease Z [Sphingomonadaceae bacterium]
MLDVMLLGTGGMTPLPHRFLASAILRHLGRMVLIDCGEGTQISLKMKGPLPTEGPPVEGSSCRAGAAGRSGWGFKEISVILLTHLHADHVAGLPGMLLTIGNSGRRDPLLLYGPPDLLRVVEGVRAMAPQLPFPLEWQELAGGEELHLGGIEVSCLAVDHGVPCLAYCVHVPRGRRFNPERARELGIPVHLWGRLQGGEPIEWEGRRVEPAEVLGGERRGIKLCYVTDTRPTPELPGFVEGADLLICEGMYGDPGDRNKAEGNRHMLFSEAAEIARRGGVGELWLTHFSPSLSDPAEWLEEATRIFPNTRIGHDRMAASLRFPSDE